jgi:hypothetical protein
VRDEYLSINTLERWAEVIRALSEARGAKAVVAPSPALAPP